MVLKDPVLEAKWLEALRSGKYEQGHYDLRRKNGYCCLGVLCDIIDPSAWNKVSESEKYTTYTWGPKGDAGYLSSALQTELGMSNEDMWELMGMNDGGDYDFNGIAERIETGKKPAPNVSED